MAKRLFNESATFHAETDNFCQFLPDKAAAILLTALKNL